ncbi:uncharacterized protein CBL_06076 [Carabus blaptoides fortunei]
MLTIIAISACLVKRFVNVICQSEFLTDYYILYRRRGLQLGVRLTPRVACLIDQSPGRAVHCLDLSATCPSVPCQPVHFGYAIPIRVKELPEGLAELVLELPELSPRAAAFLLAHHPYLREASMATTATATSKPVRCEPDEDIAAIAKQISDHAEAIYQTWKSRGLAPADILTCHNNETAADRFGSALTPPSAPQRSPSIELLAQAPTMDNNRLERLVNNFVTEDKARIAAAKSRQPTPVDPATKQVPTSIQYARQKFEKNVPQPNTLQPEVSSVLTPTTTVQTKISTLGPKPQISPKPRFPPADTIEFTLPGDMSQQKGPGLQTWPLKNRFVGTDTVKQRAVAEVKSSIMSSCGAKVPAMAANNKANTAMDQVALEEKRLLNALQNGVILTDDSSTPNKPVLTKPATMPSTETVTRWGPRTGRRPEHQLAPHPELTNTQRQHLRQVQQTAASPNPVRPFLTRGSVAERVLIFERCPSELLLDKRPRVPATSKYQLPMKQLPAHTTLQRHVKANKNVLIPRFYFPQGKPAPAGHLDGIKIKIQAAFSQSADRMSRDQFVPLMQVCELPMYWKVPLFLAAGGDCGFVTKEKFLNFWSQMVNSCHDAAARFTYILTRGSRNWLCPEDFIPLVQDVVETHPGLTFLKEAAEFHSRYVHTVIARIFYCVNRSWSGRISLPELRRSNLLTVLQLLEEEEDINQITAYFSYEHFYVIYCKFWELDRDHDLFIDKQDLTRHNDHALSTRIIDRIFSGAVTRGQHRLQQEEKMSYTEFVWFLLSEEDKTQPTAVEYWFRCMDLDGDGFLSMYELEYFYDEQMHRMEAIGIETLPFQDCLCQMLDMIKPATPGQISLSDLKRCKMTPIFFDTFFNLEKYLDHEQRDPFASQRDHDGDGQEMSDWDRYAAEEYELLVAEEGNGDQPDSISLDEKIRDDEEDLLSPNLDIVLNEVFDTTVDDRFPEQNGHINFLSDDEEGDYAPDSDDCSI